MIEPTSDPTGTSVLLQALTSVGLLLIGWLLGLGTDVIREWRTQRRIKRALIDELNDLDGKVKDVQFATARTLRLFAHNLVDPAMSLAIEHPIYVNYYKEVAHRLAPSQRYSFEIIHGQIQSLNETLEEIKILRDNIYSKADPVAFDMWSALVKERYLNAASVRFHIQHHLQRQNDPKIEAGSESHELYMKSQREIRHRIKQIVDEAKADDVKSILIDQGMEIEPVSALKYRSQRNDK